MKIREILLLLFILMTSCKPKVTIEDNKGNVIELKTNKIEYTTSERESRKEEKIIQSINKFLENRTESVVKNYWFLCDTSNIKIHRTYEVRHKHENIDIHIGHKNVTISAIPSSYKIAEGQIAEYKIFDDSLGQLNSYFIEIELTENYEVKDYKGILRFGKRQENGLNRVTFKKEILKGENYLIEEKIKNGGW